MAKAHYIFLWINSGSTTLSHYTWQQMEATQFITKGRKNTFPMTQYARSQNHSDLPNHAVRRLQLLLKLPLQATAVLSGSRFQRQDLQYNRCSDKGWQNSISSAKLSPREYDWDLKTYYYQNETKGSHHNTSQFYRNFPNQNKWEEHQ